MRDSTGTTVVVTGAGSGFGLELSRIAARRGMNVVMADVQPNALALAAREIEALGVPVLPLHADVSKSADVEAIAAATMARFGAPHLVFNNAGVGAGGLIWEQSERDWAWVLGVNLMGVVHGVRIFTPLMLEAARANAGYRGHIVNTASMAGLVNAPNMGVYNVSKHAVVSLSETLYQDLSLVTEQVRAHVLCPFFVPTGIHLSERNRPAHMKSDVPATRRQLISHAMSEKAVNSGRVTAAQVAQWVFDACDEDRFYVFSHPKALAAVQVRLEDVMNARNPSDPFKDKPEIGRTLREALRDAGGI